MKEIITVNPCKMGVYRITCIISGKNYIGSTKGYFRRRWMQHRQILRIGKHHSLTLQRAWDKHGEESFEFHSIEFIQSIEELIACEQKWIDFYQSFNSKYGYNISSIAGRRELTPKDIARLTELNRTRLWTPEARNKISIANKGRQRSVEARKLAADKNRGKKRSDQTKSKIAAALRGISHDAERRAKNSIGQRDFDYLVVASDGTEYRPQNLAEFCREHKLNKTNLKRTANGMYSQHKGYKLFRVPRILVPPQAQRNLP